MVPKLVTRAALPAMVTPNVVPLIRPPVAPLRPLATVPRRQEFEAVRAARDHPGVDDLSGGAKGDGAADSPSIGQGRRRATEIHPVGDVADCAGGRQVVQRAAILKPHAVVHHAEIDHRAGGAADRRPAAQIARGAVEHIAAGLQVDAVAAEQSAMADGGVVDYRGGAPTARTTALIEAMVSLPGPLTTVPPLPR